jgi:uncharacterized protein with HEPN domain
MRRDDAIQVIEESVAKIEKFLQGKDFVGFSRDDLIRDAVIRNLEFVSLACRHIGADAQSLDASWQKLAKLGDILQSEYYALNNVALWETIKTDLPKLDTTVRQLHARTEPSSLD